MLFFYILKMKQSKMVCMHVCRYKYAFERPGAHVYLNEQMHMFIWKFMCMHAFKHARMHLNMQMHWCTWTCTNVCTHMHMSTCMCMHWYARNCMHGSASACAHRCIHVYVGAHKCYIGDTLQWLQAGSKPFRFLFLKFFHHQNNS